MLKKFGRYGLTLLLTIITNIGNTNDYDRSR